MPPGEENQELSDQLATSTEQGQETTSQPYVQDNGQAERLLTTSRDAQQTQRTGQEQQKLLAGKYRTPQELEKAYLSQNGGYRQLETRAQKLEKMLENPKFQEMAANDPDMRTALKELGYELVDEETRRDERTGGGAWDGNMNSPDFKIAVVEHRQQMFFDRMELEHELGRKLSRDEWAEIRRNIIMAPRMPVRVAWKLTPQYEQMLKEREEKAVAAASRRPSVQRPRPAGQQGLGGPKPQGKSALGLRDDEKGQFLQDLIDKSERGA